MQAGTEIGHEGQPVGRDPRRMTHDELRQMGHEPMSAQAALRRHCLDCCGGSPADVRMCTALKCPTWPFRMGKSPWKEKRVLSEGQRSALAAARARAGSVRSGAEIVASSEGPAAEAVGPLLGPVPRVAPAESPVLAAPAPASTMRRRAP